MAVRDILLASLVLLSAGCSLVGPGDDINVGRGQGPAECTAAEPFWRFEEGEGPRSRDSSSAANDLSLVDAAAFSDDVPPALTATSLHSLELFENGYLLADQDLATWLAGDASVSYWLKVKSFPPSNDPARRILCGWKWGVSWGAVWWDGALGLLTSGDDQAKGPRDLELGVWHHIAQSRDSATGELRVYMDGQLGTPRPGLTGVASDPFREIGRNGPEVGAGMDALIDDVRLFAHVLTADDVAVLAQGNASSSAALCKP